MSVLNKIKASIFSRLALHILFWSGTLLFYTYFFGTDNDDFSYVISFSLFLMPITIITTYVSIYKLIPDYLIKKKYALFVLYSFYTLIISSYLIVISVFYGLVYLSDFQHDNMPPISRNLLFVSIAVYLVVIVVSAFKLLKLNLKQTENTSLLEKQILETKLKLKEQELHFLKMQIHPHFLFNTLNTMYGFALKKADETPEMILKLSNLLDYLLYQVDKPFVLLKDDIEHIQDYIELEKLRFNDTLEIIFTNKGIPDSVKIAPMLLIPFVENSFKHGVIKAGKLKVIIHVGYENGKIVFNIENTSIASEAKENGIGLNNTRKRLEFLYKNNYDLSIANQDNIFKVNLIINTL